MIPIEQSILLAALLLLIVLVVGLTLFALRIKSTLRQQANNQAAMQTDLRAICNAAVQMGEKVNRIENEFKTLQQRQQELGVRQDKMSQSEPHDASFDQAIKMARKGGSVEEIMEICGLSRGEAELIAMMHRLDPKG